MFCVQELVGPYSAGGYGRLDNRQELLCALRPTSTILSRRLSVKRQWVLLIPVEIRVEVLLKEGKTNKEIAEVLLVSKNTILFHRYISETN